MRLLFVFLAFLFTTYAIKTFIDFFKFPPLEILFENIPLFILAILFGTYFERNFKKNKRRQTYTKLILVSIAGLLSAKIILYFQWYWIIAPQYRDIPGDMSIGLAVTMIFSIISILVITISYIFVSLASEHSKEK